MKGILTSVLLLAWFTVAAQAGRDGQLVVFTGDPASVVTRDLTDKWVPRLKEMAEKQGVELRLVDATKGAPQDIQFTPALVYQNAKGRSLYVGRYQLVDKVKTFIRTAKQRPQENIPVEKHDVMVGRFGRATLLNPVKLTGLAGFLPKGFDSTAFRRDALAALDAGMAQFSFKETHGASRNDRLVYTAVYPYRGEDGRLHVTFEVYAQFNCVEPVYKRFDTPVSGKWGDRAKVFKEVGALLEAQVLGLGSSVANGDGWLPLPADLKTVGWEALGLPLPAAAGPSAGAVDVKDRVLGRSWAVDGPSGEGVPMVGFAFPAPMDSYAGEVEGLNGRLLLGEGLDLRSASGTFAVDMHSLTMGDPSLDHSVHGMLKVVEYPSASFRFVRVLSAENPNVAFGLGSVLRVEGVLLFMGLEAPVVVTAVLEPVLDDAGNVRLSVEAFFEIRLKERWGVKGPDGPEPARDTVKFTLSFWMKEGA